MSTRAYKRGAEDTLNAINAWVGKMSSTTDFAIKEIGDILRKAKECGDNVEKLYEYISENERKAFYRIIPSYDIRELEKEEKYVLVGILYQLAIDKPNNANQKKYIQKIQKYLDIKDNPTTIYLDVIGNIENLAVQKAIKDAEKKKQEEEKRIKRELRRQKRELKNKEKVSEHLK